MDGEWKGPGLPLTQGFKWDRTHCNVSARRFFCEWECPSQETLEGAFCAGEVPFEEIHPVRLFNATKEAVGVRIAYLTKGHIEEERLLACVFDTLCRQSDGKLQAP